MKYFYFFIFFYVNSVEETQLTSGDEDLKSFTYQQNVGFFDKIGEKTYYFACNFLCCFS